MSYRQNHTDIELYIRDELYKNIIKYLKNESSIEVEFFDKTVIILKYFSTKKKFKRCRVWIAPAFDDHFLLIYFNSIGHSTDKSTFDVADPQLESTIVNFIKTRASGYGKNKKQKARRKEI